MKKIILNANENPYNPYEVIKNELIEVTKNISFNRYPNNDYISLREKYAKYIGLEKNNVLCGNGSDEMIELIISKNINKDDIILGLDPDFSMYDFYSKLNQGIIKKYKFSLNSFDIDNFIEYGKILNPKIILFSNPNNPSGKIINNIDIEKILIEFKDSKIVVDEAYYEFYGESMIKEVEKFKNLIITRTLSKAFGLASLRVGFLISAKENISEMIKNKVPYNINNISEQIANLCLDRIELMKNSVDKVLLERKILYKELKKIENIYEDINFYKSYGNYIYANGKCANIIQKILLNENIIIRKFNENEIRITVGTREENLKLIKVIYKNLEGMKAFEKCKYN